jgi:hypothetical protein
VLITALSGTFEFEGPALALPCVSFLKNEGAGGLVEHYRAAAPPARRSCLDDLFRSLSIEPEFTRDDFQRLAMR